MCFLFSFFIDYFFDAIFDELLVIIFAIIFFERELPPASAFTIFQFTKPPPTDITPLAAFQITISLMPLRHILPHCIETLLFSIHISDDIEIDYFRH
jgi:hypothetical protein